MAASRTAAIVKCINPDQASKILKELWPGVAAVLVTLNSRFAYAVGLGAAVGQQMCETVQQIMREKLEQLSLENRKWANNGLQQACGLFGFCCSFYLSGLVNKLNSALQGGAALSKVLFEYVKSQRALPENTRSVVGKSLVPLLEKASTQLSTEEEVAKWSLAVIGFYYQVRHQSQLSLIFRVPLSPVYLVEYFLTRLAGTQRF